MAMQAVNLLSKQSSVRYANIQAIQLKSATNGSVRIVMVKATVTLSALAITIARSIRTTKGNKLFSKYKKVKKKEEKKKKPNNKKLKKLWEEYKTFKNRSVTNIARRDRKQNIINDLKAKSARND